MAAFSQISSLVAFGSLGSGLVLAHALKSKSAAIGAVWWIFMRVQCAYPGNCELTPARQAVDQPRQPGLRDVTFIGFVAPSAPLGALVVSSHPGAKGA